MPSSRSPGPGTALFLGTTLSIVVYLAITSSSGVLQRRTGNLAVAARARVLLTDVEVRSTAACKVFDFLAADPVPFQHLSAAHSPAVGKGHQFRALQVLLNDAGKVARIRVSESCDRELQRHGGSGQRFESFRRVYNYQVVRDAPPQGRAQCRRLSGTWLLVSDKAGRLQNNIFDRLATEWYAAWLVTKALPRSRQQGPLSVTHLNGNRGGASHPYLPIYKLFGRYVQWERLSQAAARQGAGCLEFEEAIVAATGWMWVATPLHTYHSGPLQEFAEGVVASLGQANVAPDPCRPGVLLAARDPNGIKKARYVLNEQELLGALRAALPDRSIQHLDLGALGLANAIRAVRQAGVLVFPHGGAGPNVLWLTRGSVAIELFPHQTADPMYRNLAVLTGKVYLSWQAQSFAEARPVLSGSAYQKNSYHFSPASAFYVNAAEVAQLVQTATLVLKGNLGPRWAPSNAANFSTALTPWGNATVAALACS